MGSDPDEFGPAAAQLAAAGYDVIDINFGCPVKKVLGRCRGGYLLSQPETALEIVVASASTVPPEKPVTVKMRRGMDDTRESRDKFFQDLRWRVRPRRRGHYGARPNGRAALRRPQPVGILARSEAARRRAHGAGQRRFVHGRKIAWR